MLEKASGTTLLELSLNVREPKEENAGRCLLANAGFELGVVEFDGFDGFNGFDGIGFEFEFEVGTHFLCLTGIVCQDSDIFRRDISPTTTIGVNFLY